MALTTLNYNGAGFSDGLPVTLGSLIWSARS